MSVSGSVDKEEPHPRGRRLCVPVCGGGVGLVVRLFATPLGTATAAAFTSPRRLARTLGPRQPWVVLTERALRDLLAPLEVTLVTIDPTLARPAPPPPSTVPVAEAVSALPLTAADADPAKDFLAAPRAGAR